MVCRPFDESHGLNTILCPDDGTGTGLSFPVTLLYRPGHYDMLYPLE